MATYTFTILDVSKETFEEISKKLFDANYLHSFHEVNNQQIVDMHGIAIRKEKQKPLPNDQVIYVRKDKPTTEDLAVKFADEKYKELHEHAWDCLYEGYMAGAKNPVVEFEKR
jgi:hypothetical protein